MLALVLCPALNPYLQDLTFTDIYLPVLVLLLSSRPRPGERRSSALPHYSMALLVKGLITDPANMIDIAEFAGAMIVINEKGITRSFSAPAVRLFGWSPDDVVGMNVSRLMPQLYRAEHERYIERYVANGERPIIGMGRIVVGEWSDGSTSVGEAIARAERLSPISSETSLRAGAGMTVARSAIRTRARVAADRHWCEMASSIAHEDEPPALRNYKQYARTKALLAPDKSDATALVMHSNLPPKRLYAPKISSSAGRNSLSGACTLWRGAHAP
ncbi:PAS domain S-box-containing protein [Bradyrhizobium sp. CIR18]|uniref:PAS domain S-box protein n=1 Tax=Bradyrhizobium sp. CIR18 TaxID=2663839 RepID=UPI001800EC47|nr:PAS domain S-box protein [Bradyrhizobium sp. CIR18]MBB4366850.1 PAS domain S-box-containing protein [Bradyrhizobium sp. CIR18]